MLTMRMTSPPRTLLPLRAMLPLRVILLLRTMLLHLRHIRKQNSGFMMMFPMQMMLNL